MQHYQGIMGILFIVLSAWCLGRINHRGETRPQPSGLIIASGIGSQFLLAALLLHLPLLQNLLLSLNHAVVAIGNATEAGTSLVFGYLGGGAAPFATNEPANSYILAFRALPLVIVFSVLSALLWHWRITPLLINGFTWLLQRLFGIGGAAGLGSASSIFIGMVESPLLIRAHFNRMSESDLFIVMTCGMATVAGTVMLLYATFLGNVIDNALSHILTASVISAPAAIMLALLIKPGRHKDSIEKNTAQGSSSADGNESLAYQSTMHAITRGTEDGLKLFLNIIAMLIVFVALVHLANQLLGLLPTLNQQPITLERLLGYVFAPFMWLIGIPWHEAHTAGQLMGTKVVINELLAFLQLSQLPADNLSDSSKLILTYALCGFANFGSLGIMLAGLSAMCPQRMSLFIRLAPLSIVSGVLATLLTGAVIGLII